MDGWLGSSRLRPSRRVLESDLRSAPLDLAPVVTIDVSATSAPRLPLLLFGEKSLSSDKVAIAFRVGALCALMLVCRAFGGDRLGELELPSCALPNAPPAFSTLASRL